jgi:hypothetical protein
MVSKVGTLWKYVFSFSFLVSSNFLIFWKLIKNNKKLKTNVRNKLSNTY